MKKLTLKKTLASLIMVGMFSLNASVVSGEEKPVVYKTEEDKVIESIDKTLSSIVTIRIDGHYSAGFFVNKDTVLTAYHGVSFAERGEVKLYTYDGYNFTGTIVSIDPKLDIAALKVNYAPEQHTSISLASDVKLGQTAIAAGTPMDYEFTFTRGIVSNLKLKNAENFFQMDTPINPGNSGGPVINSNGELIGIALRTYKPTEANDLGYALKLSAIKEFLERKKIDYTKVEAK